MRFGFLMPFGDAADIADAAVLAESSGWDRFHPPRHHDHAPATVRPWDLASKAGTLDRLCGGRVQLAVGLGAVHQGRTAFEADAGRRAWVKKMDEGLAMCAGLMAGQPFSYQGTHKHRHNYRVHAPRAVGPAAVPTGVGRRCRKGRRSAPAIAQAGNTVARLAPTGRRQRLVRQTPVAGGALRPDQPGATDARTQDCPGRSSTSASTASSTVRTG